MSTSAELLHATHMVHNNGAAIFVKDRAFFVEQGGDRSDWGKAWLPIVADSIEDARRKAATWTATVWEEARRNAREDTGTTPHQPTLSIHQGPVSVPPLALRPLVPLPGEVWECLHRNRGARPVFIRGTAMDEDKPIPNVVLAEAVPTDAERQGLNPQVELIQLHACYMAEEDYWGDYLLTTCIWSSDPARIGKHCMRMLVLLPQAGDVWITAAGERAVVMDSAWLDADGNPEGPARYADCTDGARVSGRFTVGYTIATGDRTGQRFRWGDSALTDYADRLLRRYDKDRDGALQQVSASARAKSGVTA